MTFLRPLVVYVTVAALAATLGPADAATQASPRDFTYPTAQAQRAVQPANPMEATRGEIGTKNTVTADAPVPRPNEAPCVDLLFTNATFAKYAGVPFSYSPPGGCPGPYAKIVFNGNFSVSAGIQFDRTASIQVGNVPLFFGTTAEPDPTLAPSWHVERDVTDDAALLAAPHSGEADIFNIVNSTYTGIISGTAYLQFYPARGQFAPAATPDLVLPFPGKAGGPQPLNTGASVLTATYTLPTNIDRAYFDVYAQSQQTDEQYFLCAPSDVASGLFTCGNTALRETEIGIDGKPAGVAPVYPWIYTGGLDPYLWAPIPGVQTLEFKPYRVDLTPFAAMLANGKPHTVTLSVDNADHYFQAIGTLFAYADHGSKFVTGALTSDTLAAHPKLAVNEKLTGASPSIAGTINVTASRRYQIAGYVNTSRGRVSTSLTGSLIFANVQSYSNESATTGTLMTQQGTNASTEVLTAGPDGFDSKVHIVSFPLSVSLKTVLDATGTGTQVSSIDQHFIDVNAETGSHGNFGSYESNEVTPTDTLDILNGSSITGNADQASSQTYQLFTTGGVCYTQSIKAAKNVLVAVANGPCDRLTAAHVLRPLMVAK